MKRLQQDQGVTISSRSEVPPLGGHRRLRWEPSTTMGQTTNPLRPNSSRDDAETFRGGIQTARGGRHTGEVTGRGDNTSRGHKALVAATTTCGRAGGTAAQPTLGGFGSSCCVTTTQSAEMVQSPHTPSSCTGTGARLGNMGCGDGGTILLWSFSRRVRKEREKELTVPWTGAGVKDEAVAMEA